MLFSYERLISAFRSLSDLVAVVVVIIIIVEAAAVVVDASASLSSPSPARRGDGFFVRTYPSVFHAALIDIYLLGQ